MTAVSRWSEGREKRGVPQGIILYLPMWLMGIPQPAGFIPQSPLEEHLGPGLIAGQGSGWQKEWESQQAGLCLSTSWSWPKSTSEG